jgi:hypothetical protein
MARIQYAHRETIPDILTIAWYNRVVHMILALQIDIGPWFALQ